MKIIRLAVFLAIPLALSACASFPGSTKYLEALQQTTPSGTAFTQALSQEYKAFAEAERNEYDWISSQHFAKKGLQAANGETVLPENVEDWSLGEAKEEIATQRERLMRVLQSDYATQRLPSLTATAQVKFDCWIEQQSEGWQTDDIAACRNDFKAAVEAIENQAAIILPVASNVEMVFFGFNSTKLDADALDVVAQIAVTLREADYPKTRIVGYTDSVGRADYNLRLSKFRAESVRKALISLGVPAESLSVSAEGMNDLLVPTGINVREARNRRVNIITEK